LKKIINMKKPYQHINDFDSVVLKLASPDVIRGWSHGEVTKPETINYRTQRSEKHGLFDEKIFGPERDFECFCGKYKGIRYKGILCDRCGVELTRSIVRRERMGHIELATPVSHVWFLKSVPSRIALFLGLSATDVEKVIYFAGYVITKVHADERERILQEIETEYKTKLKGVTKDTDKKKLKDLRSNAQKEIDSIEEGSVLDEAKYHKFSVKYGTLFEAAIGAEAIFTVLKNTNLEKYVEKLQERREKAGAAERTKIDKRTALIRSMIRAGVRPEWMFITALPVSPPALRPMVALEGGRHATSDVNDLYRRVINRNNRLKKLMDINAPEVILRNEKRILQEAVDALVDGTMKHGNAMSGMGQGGRRPLKSLADYLRGKQGYFRQNLLGKRVDYSGRSVIVVGPELSLDECGLPKKMALELFRPFVIAKLIERQIAFNTPGAGRLIADGVPEVWAILEEVIRDKYVLLNRAPTLHRLGIQAFKPILVEGNAIRIHPLVCPAFNADFDGDQMAVHVPLSDEAQFEAREIISARKGILKPGNAEPTVSPTQDIVLGCYWMTRAIAGKKGEGKYYQSPNAAITAYDLRAVDLRAKILVLPTSSDKYKEFNGELFETSVGRLLFNGILPKNYPFLNKDITKRELKQIVDDVIDQYGLEEVPDVMDKIKDFGFKYATKSGTTWGLTDVQVPEGKKDIVKALVDELHMIESQYKEGLLSVEELKRMRIEASHQSKGDLEDLVVKEIGVNSSVHDIVDSGSRGSAGQLTQMAGMKGLVQNAQGETIDTPIFDSMKEGLSPNGYFISTNGARKGLADTALQTAKAGYLTRKLFDSAQDVIIDEKDCGTKNGIALNRKSASGIEINFSRAIFGRVLVDEVKAGKEVLKKGTLITREIATLIGSDEKIQSVKVRSPMTCNTLGGVCAQCYGADPTSHELIEVGEAVGTMAAQAIGEPGTQLTMNTKHAGAASRGGDVVQGLPRVEEVFERRSPKSPAIVAKANGIISKIEAEGQDRRLIVASEGKKKEIEYLVPYPRTVLVKEGQEVKAGELMSDGSADLQDLHKYAGQEVVQEYVIQETSKIYELQGVTIDRKHIEIVVKQMFSRVLVSDGGDTHLNRGDTVEKHHFIQANKDAKADGRELAEGDVVVLGIKESALTRKSFLSAASFENTTKTLINAAVRGAVDTLKGPKENIIIGRLIPAGTGFEGSEKWKNLEKYRESFYEDEQEEETGAATKE